ncbi:MAG: glucokinase [Bacteroidota bacterium]
MILAGDIGGTKTNLALFEVLQGKLMMRETRSYPSHEFTSLSAVLESFRKDCPEKYTAAAFGIAGPVVNGHCHLTNLGWEMDAKDIQTQLGIREVELMNDLQAMSYGTLHLGENEKVRLQEGEVQLHGSIAVIAAGTGLGEGALVWDGRQYRAIASEGGHSDFSPRNVLESDLLKFLAEKFGHVSWERILSGPGIFSLYEFFRRRSADPEPTWLRDAIRSGDPAAAVSRAGMEGKDRVCSDALDLFVSLYGAEAGNLALKFLGNGGVFIGGGIAPKILAKMRSGRFMESFSGKGRFNSMLQRISVSVILNDRIALFGAAHVAQLLAAD